MKLIHIIDWWSTLLFPKSRAYQIVAEADAAAMQAVYSPLHHETVTWLASYHHPLLKASVVSAKFEHNDKALTLLSMLLREYLSADSRQTTIIPIPLHKKRQRKRGYNQVTEVARRAVRGLPHCVLDTHRLVRSKATPPQTSLTRADRLKNMRDAFTWRTHEVDWSGVERVLICDDVYTTGATLRAAKAVVEQQVPKGVVVECIAWGH